AGPSSGWRSPRLTALITLSARYVLKMASSRSSSASTASIAVSTTSAGASSWTTMLAIVPIVGATLRTPVERGVLGSAPIDDGLEGRSVALGGDRRPADGVERGARLDRSVVEDRQRLGIDGDRPSATARLLERLDVAALAVRGDEGLDLHRTPTGLHGRSGLVLAARLRRGGNRRGDRPLHGG